MQKKSLGSSLQENEDYWLLNNTSDIVILNQKLILSQNFTLINDNNDKMILKFINGSFVITDEVTLAIKNFEFIFINVDSFYIFSLNLSILILEVKINNYSFLFLINPQFDRIA